LIQSPLFLAIDSFKSIILKRGLVLSKQGTWMPDLWQQVEVGANWISILSPQLLVQVIS
jgi:hypothetical protein